MRVPVGQTRPTSTVWAMSDDGAPRETSYRLPMRLLDVVVAPVTLFRRLGRARCYVAPLCCSILIAGVASGAFLQTSIGQALLEDARLQTLRSLRARLSSERYAEVAAQLTVRESTGLDVAIQTMARVGLQAVLLAALVYLILLKWRGKYVRYPAVLTVFAHTALILAMEQVFLMALNSASWSLHRSATLEAMLPFLRGGDEGGLLALLLHVNPFSLWWMAATAVGLSVVYRAAIGLFWWPMFALYFLVLLPTVFGGGSAYVRGPMGHTGLW